ncbi:hypothetical protein Q5P01_006917 [Channa striata]|uniref:ZP domain-containing protein n=1 Tax=Channa striata TaxID=64152 RepID=A0AA88N8U8_CHASR|nr:hypothetical protein Q5P01_006917 [Channa striata]
MSSLTPLLPCLLLMVSAATAQNYRFYGGSVSLNSKRQKSDSTYQVELREKHTTVNCNQNAYVCYYGDCGSQIQTTSTLISSNSYGLSWCQYEQVTTIKRSSDLPFAVRYPGYHDYSLGRGYWVENIKSSQSGLEMMAHVDLGTRSDTRRSNSLPVTTILPVLRVPRNCPRSFNTTVLDLDGDQVRCRVPTDPSTHECGLCGETNGFSLDENSCALTFSPSYSTGSGYYPLELVVEDFPHDSITLSYSDGSSTSKGPFSGVRLDGYSAPSCLDGDYFPIFLPPTPTNGAHLPAFANHPLKVKVRSSAQYSTIYDLIVTGPSGISVQRISTEEFVIQWTPSKDEWNQIFPICFVSEATDRSNQVYQSELRCVVVEVGHHETTVTCSETTMTVEVQKDDVISPNENNLRLINFTDSSCDLARLSNSTHLVAVISLNACGTIIEEDEGNIIFRNEITSAAPNQITSRSNDIQIAFLCVYPRRTNLTLGHIHNDPYVFTDKGFGTFTFQFEFFESQLFLNQINASSYPVEVDLKQTMFMQIEAVTPIPNVELFVESCRATPHNNLNSHISYSIFENGCVKDKTVQIYSGSHNQFRFAMEAFEFIGAYPEVYITCSVILCETGAPGARCSQGCTSSDHRHKREAGAETSRHSISQGPLRMLRTADKPTFGLIMNLGLNLIFVVGCLLVCGVVIYRSKRLQIKYQPLPTSDPD